MYSYDWEYELCGYYDAFLVSYFVDWKLYIKVGPN